MEVKDEAYVDVHELIQNFASFSSIQHKEENDGKQKNPADLL